MHFIPTTIPEVLILEPQVFRDERGFFMETFHEEKFAALGLPTRFVQDNHSASRRGVLRGLHYQIQHAQGKLVRVISGEVFDVAVDLRRSSPTFGQWVGEVLSAATPRMMWIPPGFAHGFLVLTDWAEVLYKTTDFYAPQWERTLLWNDPVVGVRWQIQPGEQPLLSEKDQRGLPLAQCETYP